MNTLFALIFAMLPACAVEDDNWCKWDATLHGNGTGKSFITLADHTFLQIVN